MISQQTSLACQDSAAIDLQAMPAANLIEFITRARNLAVKSDYWRGLHIRANREAKRRCKKAKEKPLQTTANSCKGFTKTI